MLDQYPNWRAHFCSRGKRFPVWNSSPPQKKKECYNYQKVHRNLILTCFIVVSLRSLITFVFHSSTPYFFLDQASLVIDFVKLSLKICCGVHFFFLIQGIHVFLFEKSQVNLFVIVKVINFKILQLALKMFLLFVNFVF